MSRRRIISIIMSILLFIGSTCVIAQSEATEQGSMIVSGMFSIVNQSGDLYAGDDESATTITIEPNVIYFIAPKVGLSADAFYSGRFRDDISLNSWGIGPGIGYFFDSGTSAIPYISGGVNYISLYEEHDNGYRYKLGLGVLFRKDHLAISVEIGYMHDRNKFEYYNAWSNVKNKKTFTGDTVGISVGVAGFLY